MSKVKHSYLKLRAAGMYLFFWSTLSSLLLLILQREVFFGKPNSTITLSYSSISFSSQHLFELLLLIIVSPLTCEPRKNMASPTVLYCSIFRIYSSI